MPVTTCMRMKARLAITAHGITCFCRSPSSTFSRPSSTQSGAEVGPAMCRIWLVTEAWAVVMASMP